MINDFFEKYTDSDILKVLIKDKINIDTYELFDLDTIL